MEHAGSNRDAVFTFEENACVLVGFYDDLLLIEKDKTDILTVIDEGP